MDRLHHKTNGGGLRLLVKRQEWVRDQELSSRKSPRVSKQESLGSESSLTRGMNNLDVEEYQSRGQRAGKEHGVACSNCQTRDYSQIKIDSSGCGVCSCGAVHKAVRFGEDFDEVGDKSKSGARASFPSRKDASDSKHGIKAILENLKEAGTRVGQSSSRRLNLGFAQEQALRQSDYVADLELPRGMVRKLTSIIQTIDKLIAQVGPVPNELARKIRMDADFVFHLSVKHGRVCKHEWCQRALHNKPTGVVACKSMLYTLEQLVLGDGIDGVSKHSIVAVQERVNSSQIFSPHDNAAQSRSCVAILAALWSGGNECECQPCSPEDHPSDANAVKTIIERTYQMSRQDSNPLAKSAPPVMKLRDSLGRLSVELQLPSSVKECAIASLQTSEIAAVVNDKTVVPEVGPSAAYMVVAAAARKNGTSVESNPKEHAARLLRFGLSKDQFAKAVTRLESVMQNAPSCSLVDSEFFY